MFTPLTPIRFLYRAVDLFGKSIGIVSGDRQFTYAEFGRRCEQLASSLLAMRVQPGDRVAYLSFNTNQLVEGYYGVPMAGAIVMPLNVRLTPPELGAILEHSGAKILFYEPEFDAIPAGLPVQQRIRLDEEYETLLASAEPKRVDYMNVDENSTAELFYTSGSTGTPKGCDAVAPDRLSPRLIRSDMLFRTLRHGGPAYDPAISRERLGPCARIHDDGREAGHGPALRSRSRVRADRRAPRNRHESGADDGQRSPRGGRH